MRCLGTVTYVISVLHAVERRERGRKEYCIIKAFFSEFNLTIPIEQLADEVVAVSFLCVDFIFYTHSSLRNQACFLHDTP